MPRSLFLEEALPTPAPADARYVWGKVTQSTPLRIQLDGDRTPLLITPDDLGTTIRPLNQRVYCQMLDRRLVVLGPAGSSGPGLLIPAGADLNSYVTPGSYVQDSSVNASVGLHYPVAAAGVLVVEASPGTRVWQRYVTVGPTPREFLRYLTSDGVTVNPWVESITGSGSGAWAAYTPTIGGLTVGNGVVDAQYTEVGKMITARVGISFGTTTAFTSGDVTFTLPHPAQNAPRSGLATGRISGAGNAFSLACWAASGSTTQIIRYIAPSTGILTGLSATAPGTWSSSGWLEAEVTYEGT